LEAVYFINKNLFYAEAFSCMDFSVVIALCTPPHYGDGMLWLRAVVLRLCYSR